MSNVFFGEESIIWNELEWSLRRSSLRTIWYVVSGALWCAFAISLGLGYKYISKI